MYWDDFELRIIETVDCIKAGKVPPIRRVAVFITDQCNFKCKYCNNNSTKRTLTKQTFQSILDKYGDAAIIHITGGEPSLVPWLYNFLEENKSKYKFHLNTNAYITPPYKAIKRLKVSLDHFDKNYWDPLVGHKGAFDKIIRNIKDAIPYTIVSITCTITKENYKDAPKFIEFVNKEFPGLYAVFFSVYKGNNPNFILTDEDADIFFSLIMPKLESLLPLESLSLIKETIDEKRRLIQGVRFPENLFDNCYISMSEIVVSPDGIEYNCSHLYRDGIHQIDNKKHQKCSYGCNRRLIAFNEEVKLLLEERTLN